MQRHKIVLRLLLSRAFQPKQGIAELKTKQADRGHFKPDNELPFRQLDWERRSSDVSLALLPMCQDGEI